MLYSTLVISLSSSLRNSAILCSSLLYSSLVYTALLYFYSTPTLPYLYPYSTLLCSTVPCSTLLCLLYSALLSLLCSTLPYSTLLSLVFFALTLRCSTLPLLYSTSTLPLLYFAQVPTGHNDLWASENVTE